MIRLSNCGSSGSWSGSWSAAAGWLTEANIHAARAGRKWQVGGISGLLRVVPLDPLDTPQVDPLQKHGQLAGLHLYRGRPFGGAGEAERALLQPLVPEGEPVPVPVQDLQPVHPRSPSIS